MGPALAADVDDGRHAGGHESGPSLVMYGWPTVGPARRGRPTVMTGPTKIRGSRANPAATTAAWAASTAPDRPPVRCPLTTTTAVAATWLPVTRPERMPVAV